MRFFTFLLLGFMGLISLTMTTDAEAYWHGYRGGWRGGPGWRGPGWGGCFRCGPGWGAAGVVAGAAAVETAAVVAAESRPPVVVENAPVVVTQPVQVPTPVVAGTVPPGVVVESPIPPVGATYPNLFPGCVLAPKNGINFYQCQGFRMRPLYGGNGFYYRVVPG